MKCIKKSAICVLLMMTVVALCPFNSLEAHAADTTTFHVTGEYEQTSARGMLADINAFRTGSEAWYWNSTDTEKVYKTGLSALVYDYDLEKIAMQRAMEISVYYDHERPNGSSCFTAYPNNGSGAYCGENIAAGYDTAEEVFKAWREDDETYKWQGHRRNMLSSSFTGIGIGHVIRNDIHYWVQEFRNPVGSSVATPVFDGLKTVDVVCTSSNIVYDVYPDEIEVVYGNSYDLSEVKEEVKYDGVISEYINPFILQNDIGDLAVKDAEIAEISNGELLAKKAGSTELTGTLSNGDTFSIPVTVEPKSFSAVFCSVESRVSYTGSAVTPKVTVTYGGNQLIEDTDYTLSYSNNTNVGTASVTITGTGNFTGSKTLYFYIIDRGGNSSSSSGSGNTGEYGSESDDDDYEQSGKKRTVKQTTLTSLKKGKKRFIATWEKVTGVSGYELQYATDKKFKNAVTKNLKASKKSVTIKKLKAKKYYVRIRCYRTISGSKVYSKWSKAKTVKVK